MDFIIIEQKFPAYFMASVLKTVVRQRRIPFQIEADPVDDVMERGRKAFYEMRRLVAENGTAGMSLNR